MKEIWSRDGRTVSSEILLRRRDSYRCTARVRLILSLAWLLIITRLSKCSLGCRKVVSGNERADLQEDPQAFGQLVVSLEGQREDHLDKVPVH
jgi:hypothetical protein